MNRILIAFIFVLVTASAFRPAVLPMERTITNGLASAEPVKLSWEVLRDVTFKKKWYAEESVYMLYPTFGPSIQKLSGKTVDLTGYVLPVDLESNIYVLSAFPYSACFFCGGPDRSRLCRLNSRNPIRSLKPMSVTRFGARLS